MLQNNYNMDWLGMSDQAIVRELGFFLKETRLKKNLTQMALAEKSVIHPVTLNEFVPYLLYADTDIEMKRISRILTSGHSFEYIGTGTDINTSTPLKGAVPIKENEIVALDGAQIPYTSTDQKGNFNIGEGIQVDQTTATIRGREFAKAIQAQVTPLILALR